MAENEQQDILLMAILAVTRDDVLAGANELGISEEGVTDDLIELVKEKVSQELRDWRNIIKDMIKGVIKKGATECPLGMVCSPTCTWREVGGCTLPREVK